jgi:hypothetical protein
MPNEPPARIQDRPIRRKHWRSRVPASYLSPLAAVAFTMADSSKWLKTVQYEVTTIHCLTFRHEIKM